MGTLAQPTTSITKGEYMLYQENVSCDINNKNEMMLLQSEAVGRR